MKLHSFAQNDKVTALLMTNHNQVIFSCIYIITTISECQNLCSMRKVFINLPYCPDSDWETCPRLCNKLNTFPGGIFIFVIIDKPEKSKVSSTLKIKNTNQMFFTMLKVHVTKHILTKLYCVEWANMQTLNTTPNQLNRNCSLHDKNNLWASKYILLLQNSSPQKFNASNFISTQS